MENLLFKNFWVKIDPTTPQETKKIVNGLMKDFLLSKGFVYNKSRNMYCRIFNEEIIQVFTYRNESDSFWTPYFSIVPLCEVKGLIWEIFKGGDISPYVTSYDPLSNSDDRTVRRDHFASTPCILRRTPEDCIEYIMKVMNEYVFPLADRLISWEEYASFILNPQHYFVAAKSMTCFLIVGRYSSKSEWECYSENMLALVNEMIEADDPVRQEWYDHFSLINQCRESGNMEPLDKILKSAARQNFLVLENQHKYPRLGCCGAIPYWAMRYFCTHQEMTYDEMVENAPTEIKEELKKKLKV